LRVGGQNLNRAVIGYDGLLGIGLQIAKRQGLRTQVLNRVHDILRLCLEGLAERGRPAQVVVQIFENTRIPRDRFDAWVPRLQINRIWVASATDVAVGHDNF